MENLNWFSVIEWRMSFPELRITHTSDSTEKIRGYTMEEAKEQTLEEILTPDSCELVHEKISNELNLEKTTKKDIQNLDLEHFCKDGETIWMRTEINIIRDEKGQPVEIAGFSTEITDLREEIAKLKNTIKKQQEAIKLFRTLRGILPICASCKKIRDENKEWHPVEKYVQDRSEAQFSHGICPECAKKLYPEFCKEKEVE